MIEEFHLERVIGRVVRDSEGKEVGHLGEARTQRDGSELLVLDFLTGPAAMLERFSALEMARAVLQILGPRLATGYVIPWHLLDLAYPGGPRCRCRREQLQCFRGTPPAPDVLPRKENRDREP